MQPIHVTALHAIAIDLEQLGGHVSTRFQQHPNIEDLTKRVDLDTLNSIGTYIRKNLSFEKISTQSCYSYPKETTGLSRTFKILLAQNNALMLVIETKSKTNRPSQKTTRDIRSGS